MSLLMQALKKAERAKQSSPAEAEVDKPSTELDDILALTPEPAPPPTTDAMVPRRELSLDFEPSPEFSLEPPPLEPPPASLTPRPAPDPLPAVSDHKEPGLTLDIAPDPAAPVPPAAQSSAPPAPVLPTAAAVLPDLSPSAAAAGLAAAAASAGLNYDSTPGARPATAPKARPTPEAAARPERAASARAATEPPSAKKPRGAARARAATAGAEPPSIDPERLRLIGLLAILALLIIGFAYYYWQAVMAPGAGARLPPVAMPPPGATGATPMQVIGPAGPGAPAVPGSTDSSGAFGQDAGGMDATSGGMLAPSMNLNRTARDDIERRLARTEQELAAAQQAIQAQLSAPRQERLPPVAAPDNTDIRVAKAVQPSKTAPALQNAYQALNSGDLQAAQTEYDAALHQDPNNRDALLGMATVAARQNYPAQASAYYLRLLELDPKDATAVAGLIGLRAGDIAQSESRLKAILATNPEAGPVLFALGNLYAQQSRWPEAQQTYFRAYSAAPENPDYAYNLAIGLDRLNQGKLALTYYQRALTLAQSTTAAFDSNALRQRMLELGGVAR